MSSKNNSCRWRPCLKHVRDTVFAPRRYQSCRKMRELAESMQSSQSNGNNDLYSMGIVFQQEVT